MSATEQQVSISVMDLRCRRIGGICFLQFPGLFESVAQLDPNGKILRVALQVATIEFCGPAPVPRISRGVADFSICGVGFPPGVAERAFQHSIHREPILVVVSIA